MTLPRIASDAFLLGGPHRHANAMMHGVFRDTEILRDFFDDCRPKLPVVTLGPSRLALSRFWAPRVLGTHDACLASSDARSPDTHDACLCSPRLASSRLCARLPVVTFSGGWGATLTCPGSHVWVSSAT